MSKSHLKRLNAPKSWPIKRKGTTFVMKPLPGAYKLELGLPLALALRELTDYANTLKEVRKILNGGQVKVNGKVIKEPKFSVGLFDVISFDKLKKSYRIIFNKQGKFVLVEIKKEEANIKPYKILKKTNLKKGKVQLNLFSGKNILVEKDSYKVGDTIVLDSENKIVEHLKFEKGSLVYIYQGKKVPSVGKLESINVTGVGNKKIILSTENGKIETKKDYGFVIGKQKPIITISGE